MSCISGALLLTLVFSLRCIDSKLPYRYLAIGCDIYLALHSLIEIAHFHFQVFVYSLLVTPYLGAMYYCQSYLLGAYVFPFSGDVGTDGFVNTLKWFCTIVPLGCVYKPLQVTLLVMLKKHN